MAYPMYGASARRGLGYEQSGDFTAWSSRYAQRYGVVPDTIAQSGPSTDVIAFDFYRRAFEDVAGIPYVGSATTPDAMKQTLDIDTRIANGDESAILDGWRSDDTQLRNIAIAYGDRLSAYDPRASQSRAAWWVRQVLAQKMTMDEFARLTGYPITQDALYNQSVRDQFQKDVYATLNAANPDQWQYPIRFVGKSDGSLDVVGIPTTGGGSEIVITNSTDSDALAKIAAWWEQFKRDQTQLKNRAIALPRLDEVVVEDSVSPSGWRQGSLSGRTGWFAPDGLFYDGDTPWRDYTPGTGRSINAVVAPTPTPQSLPTEVPPMLPEGVRPQPVLTSVGPTIVPTPTTTPTPKPTVSTPKAWTPFAPVTPTSLREAPATGATRTSMTPLLLGAAALVLLVVLGKRNKGGA